MLKEIKDDVFYVCTMIEFVARATHNKVGDVIKYISDDDLAHELKAAPINHCLTFEQVCDEWIEKYKIANGVFDNISTCKYQVPTVTSIGRLYQQLIYNVIKDETKLIQTIREVFTSFLSEEIANYNSSLYYSNPDYLRCSYLDGTLLA